MEGEYEVPEPILEAEPSEQQPEVNAASTNAIESLSGMTELPGQPKENLNTLSSAPEPRSRMAELEGKIALPGVEYTKEEAFYLEHGWKAYLQEYGEQGYTLQEIVQAEKLDSSNIKNAIEDGTIKDPNALHLYGQMKLDHDTQYYTKWALDHIDDPQIQEEAKLLIEAAKAECEPLINGNTQDLIRYVDQQAAYGAEEAKQTTDEAKRLKLENAAFYYHVMSKRLEEQAKEENTTEAKSISSQANEVPNQVEATSTEQPEEKKEGAEETITTKEPIVTPEQQQFQELQKQFDQLKVANETLVAENTALRDTLAQISTELEEVREAIEGDKEIDPGKKEHWLIRLTKIISTLAAKALLDATDAVEDTLEK